MPHVGGPILPAGCPSVLVHGQPAARVGDRSTCVGPPDSIVMGEASVLIDNKPAARVGDPTAHGGVIVSGCGCVQIGRVAQAIVLKEAAKSGAAFCEECARKKAAEDAKKKKHKGAAKQGASSGKPGVASVPASGNHRAGRGFDNSHMTKAQRAARGKHYPLPLVPGLNNTGRAIDPQKSIDYLEQYAQTNSSGYCSRWVHAALVAGGAKDIGHGNAYTMGPNLLRSGFQEVARTGDYPGSFSPQPGDVVVFDKAPINKKEQNGHIAMWNGSEWVSDFFQNDFKPGSKYDHGTYTIYRP